jgi:hypothetical protein
MRTPSAITPGRKAVCLSLLLLFFYSSSAQDTIHLKKYVGNLKQVDVAAGADTLHLLFDTGGGETFLSPQVARRLGKTVYGRATTFRMSGEMLHYQKADSVTLTIGGKRYDHPTLGVWDLMSILPAGLPKIDGVLSLKTFAGRVLSLDLAAGKLVVETEASYRSAVKKMTLVPSRFATGMNGGELTLFLAMRRNHRPYWFLFDSGNLSDLLLSHRTAAEWGLQADTVTVRKEVGVVPVQLGKRKAEGKAASENIIYDGALNYALLSTWRFLIHLGRKEVWME